MDVLAAADGSSSGGRHVSGSNSRRGANDNGSYTDDLEAYEDGI